MDTAPFILDPSQERAVDLLCSAPVGVVTGGAGCGKTTCLRAALDRMDAAGVRYALASPTGKAAKRMHEATGREASTLHRLLEFGPTGPGYSMGFARNAQDPLDQDVVIVDEASMLDVELAAALMDALRPEARVVMIGDAQQLPSVGAGRVLADLIESGVVPVARLTQVHRAAAESWICTEAPKVLQGIRPSLDERRDFRFVAAETKLDVRDRVIEIARDLAAQGIDAQVLTPQRTTECGVEALNRALQDTLNPGRGKAWKAGDELRVGDRVIQTKNDYVRQVFNGEIGTVENFDSMTLTVRFDGRLVDYAKASSERMRLAYALTVHKYQGSEVPWAIVVCHSVHSYMLSRQLLYTALTRAKAGVILVGDRKGIDAALKDASPSQRNTELAALLAGAREQEAAA